MQNSNFWIKLIQFYSNDFGSFTLFFKNEENIMNYEEFFKRLDIKKILYVYLTSYIVNFTIFHVLMSEPAYPPLVGPPLSED
jgi:hypothetical protein